MISVLFEHGQKLRHSVHAYVEATNLDNRMAH